MGASNGVHILPNLHTAMFVAGMISTSDVVLNDDQMSLDKDEVHSRTELDSHANMVVVGRNCYVLQDTQRKANVSAFSPNYETLELPIVDAALAYYSPYDGKDYILVVRNALYVPSLEHNLIPPFIMREAGLEVRDIPKIHVSDPTEEDHSIGFPGHDFRIPLSLWGVFSCFLMTAPTLQQIEECDDVYLLTPNGRWDPNSDVYAKNESNMLDWEGNIINKKDRVQILLDEVQDSKAMVIAASISKVEATAIDNNLKGAELIFEPNDNLTLNGGMSPTYDAELLSHALEEKATESHFKVSIGATMAQNGPYVFKEVPDLMERGDDSSISDSEDGDDLDDASSSGSNDGDQVFIGEIDLDDIMASAAHARPRRTVDAEHLSKIWRIDLETAKRTLDVTSQNATRAPDASLSRNYATNDKMLRYTRIKEYFFMDTFFATKKAGKSSRGNSCCQLFVTDKGYVYVVPMKSKSEVLQAVKQFAKEIGAPEALICDAAREQKSEEVKKFCHEIGTTLRVLKEGTPWANKAELYIGLIKAAVSKDMKESNCPLAFWDYCIERRARINNLTARNLFQLHGTNPHTALTGSEGDISSLTQFGWYDFCYYRENTEKFPFNKEVLGRVLGPAKGEGNEMAQWILKANGNVVPRRSPRPLTVAEINSETEQKKRSIFDTLIEKRWGTVISPPQQL